MKTYKTPLELAKKLISLPSYVSETQDETPAIEFLEQYIRVNLPELIIERQIIAKGSPRCNLIIRGKGEPKLFVLGHIDTVQPKEGWSTDPFKPVIRDGKLYGLGAADMKSS
ncbi:MAG TPA: M20/M25/M40 family metallo-hydrolase, partial [Candidatus Saccharimonadales bacterium]